MSSNRVVPSIFRIDSEVCPFWDCSETIDFTLQCGHKVHLRCLGRYNKIQGRNYAHKCQVCQSPLNELSTYWDILRKYNMNETEIFYKNLSKTTVMARLAKYLMETKEAPLEQFLIRTYSIHNDLKALFPVEREIYENALLTGDGRIINFLKSVKWLATRSRLPERYFKFAWENDWMELITDLYEIHVFPGTFNLEKSPMNVASYTGNYELMDRLIAHGANIDFWNLDTSPLFCACISDEYDNTDEKIKFIDKYWGILKGKLKGYYGFDNGEENVFKYAIEKNDIKLTRFLIEKDVKTGINSLQHAISNGSLEMIKIIHKSSSQNFDQNALNQVCEKKSIDVIEYMFTEEKFSNFYLSCKMKDLSYENNLEIVEVFLNLGVPYEEIPFRNILKNGLFDMAKLLIYHGVKRYNKEMIAEFNFESIRNESEERINEIIGYFLSLEADINATDTCGHTALSKLCNNDKNLPVIKILVQYGAIVNTDPEMAISHQLLYCPLLIACANECTNIFKFLLRNGAEPRNCYYYALECQNLEMIKLTLPFHYTYGDDNRIYMPKSIANKLKDYLTELGIIE